jgi:hypothetical protein
MTKYISMFVIGAMASIAVIQAGQDCPASKSAKTETSCAAAKQEVAAKSGTCAGKDASACPAGKASKTAKKAPSTAKGGYRS